ncbi:hypothetical protein [Enterococcus mundtii]|nr:hypothetical protein [Enterococcus mundtii]STE38108.1 Uncharacterised protein [Enterococcus mundtii]
MTVEELIEMLEQFPQSSTVLISVEGFDCEVQEVKEKESNLISINVA